MSENGIKILASRALILANTTNALDPCDHCIAGKQRRASFAKKSTRRKEKLHLVHSDVCGPIEVESLGCNRCLVTFIDNATRKIWVYISKAKGQVFKTF